MYDATAPVLTSLVIPETVDLSSGPAELTISGTAYDEGSGVAEVVIWFDDEISRSYSLGSSSYSTYSLLGLFDDADWADGAANESWGVADTNAPGVYEVTRVTVDDMQGNSRTYLASELEAMGVNTSLELVGSTYDATAPEVGEAVASLWGPLEVVEGKAVNLSLLFSNLTNASISYSYAFTTSGGTASGGDISGASGSGAFTVVSTSSTSESIPIGLSAQADNFLEGSETAFLNVTLDGITFDDGSVTRQFEIIIVDDLRPTGSVIVSGSPVEGATLTADASDVTDPDGHRLGTEDWQWRRDGVAIPEASSSSYTLREADVGTHISATYSFKDGHGVVERMSSASVLAELSSSVERARSFSLADYNETSIELLLSGSSDLHATGNSQDNRVVGNVGDNRLKGLAGDDVLLGRKGNDALIGGGGNDKLIGHGGDDLLKGGGGDDLLKGGGGEDLLKGQKGDDVLKGGGGNDKLIGGGGKDALQGQKGNDKLIGGGGKDEFVFKRGDGRDVVKDWQDGRDSIVIKKGASGFVELDIYQKGKHAFIDYGRNGDLIKLIETDADDLDRGDFAFG
ncbi:MAG: hypothetical protein R6V44_03300 [Paracoccaceae bacterium]